MANEKLTKAIIAVMQSVKGIEKDKTVGTGTSSYQGVSDQQVKKIIGQAMAENGLVLLPISVEPTISISRWEEVDQWSKETPKPLKQKQSVLTEVKTKYLLMHESGESVELAGYGHGVDSQDKSAGKATTYALKYAMLYTFLVPTGKIDDADEVHSDQIEAPKSETKVKKTEPPKAEPPANGKFKANDVQVKRVVERIESGEISAYTAALEAFELTQDQKNILARAKEVAEEKLKAQNAQEETTVEQTVELDVPATKTKRF